MDWSPPIGESLEESPEQLRASARPVAYGEREISELTSMESAAFAEALDDTYNNYVYLHLGGIGCVSTAVWQRDTASPIFPVEREMSMFECRMLRMDPCGNAAQLRSRAA